MSSPSSLGSVLVIGGCGGLGSQLVKQLLESKEATSLSVLDISLERNRVSGVTYYKGSVSSREDVLSALNNAQPKVIFHVASPHLMHQSATPKLFEEVNILGTQNLLDCIYESGVPKVLVYTSSTGIVHNGYTDIIRATEDVPICFFPEQTEPLQYYAHTKGKAEVMIREANRKHGLLTVALRCTTLYGEGDNTTIPQMVGNAQSGRGKMQVGDGKNLFDFTYTGNAAYAHRLAARKLLAVDPTLPPPPTTSDDRIDGEVFFLTNDEPWPFWDFVRAVGTAAGCGVRREDVRVTPIWVYYAIAVVAEWAVWLFTLGRKESQINRKMIRFFSMTNTFNVTKAKTRLGYKPQWSTQEGIDRAVKAYLDSEEKKKEGKKSK
ncbi:sterol-4-alpha-carboxylate 3-dehydrogenase [Aaosphaeria arxii CBS 175.79]|uniref:Sterol-4-alpha-carboxylate 3-dehydrogenase n=1 Tax=Aaosphaeria arxii CBS 175.79 TaxID=1450172 RepID=A0A6A5XNM8_9PLEO|nr:sterol-4-alpha-carboxylate 3-dehydrogenase [Aaosphaeria arxii CBS 175.79]KAF2014340.1 sterol-4-alpha-carboxylate 3-dehydrogenase [Aaosphaeria arxii CBS 175.79]